MALSLKKAKNNIYVAAEMLCSGCIITEQQRIWLEKDDRSTSCVHNSAQIHTPLKF